MKAFRVVTSLALFNTHMRDMPTLPAAITLSVAASHCWVHKLFLKELKLKKINQLNFIG